MAGVVAGHPLDTIKVRLQQQQSKTQFSSVRMLREEGWRSFFRGMASPLVGVAIINALLFGVYKQSLMTLESMVDGGGQEEDDNESGSGNAGLGNVFAAGCIAGFVNSFISGPSELAKIKLQAKGAGRTGLRGPWDVLQRTTVRSFLATGLVATIMRETPSYGVYFLVFETLSRRIEAQRDAGRLTPWELMLAGGVSGCLGWLSTYPLDVVKTYIQTHTPLFTIHNSSSSSSNSGGGRNSMHDRPPTADHANIRIRHAVGHLWQTGGWRAFTRGLGAAMLRAFPTNAVIFWVYRECMYILE
jgi:solute carrier family 25 carnitine/acylcarnitine transporter 20/29